MGEDDEELWKLIKDVVELVKVVDIMDESIKEK